MWLCFGEKQRAILALHRQSLTVQEDTAAADQVCDYSQRQHFMWCFIPSLVGNSRQAPNSQPWWTDHLPPDNDEDDKWNGRTTRLLSVIIHSRTSTIRIIGLFNGISCFKFGFTAKDLLQEHWVNTKNGIIWICRCSEPWRFCTPGWLPIWYTTCNLLETHIQTKNFRVESPFSLKRQKQLWESCLCYGKEMWHKSTQPAC